MKNIDILFVIFSFSVLVLAQEKTIALKYNTFTLTTDLKPNITQLGVYALKSLTSNLL